jgi:hypothetical protein
MTEQLPMNHNVKLHMNQQLLLDWQQNSHRLSMKLIIGNDQCIGRLWLCMNHQILFEQSILSLMKL